MNTVVNGNIIQVDDEDAHLLHEYKWRTRVYFGRILYVECGGKKPRTIYLHRIILGVTNPKIQVDHIDGNGLNNQKSNLRCCSASENQRNARIRTDNTSGYRGVYWSNGNKRWIATIKCNKKLIYLGSSINLVDAVKLRNDAVVFYHGEFGRVSTCSPYCS